MNSEATQAAKCRCGMNMDVYGDLALCDNCDTVQVGQVLGLGRERTREDVRFDLYWARVMSTEYSRLEDGTEQGDMRWLD